MNRSNRLLLQLLCVAATAAAGDEKLL